MEINLFDYTIAEIYHKLFDAEKIQKNLIYDLAQTITSIRLKKLEYSENEFALYRATKDLKERKKALSEALEHYSLLIAFYTEYIDAMKSYFNFNKPHEVYKEDAKVLSISKYKKGE